MSDIHNAIGTAEMATQRVNYFAGQFLEDKDFKDEQSYHMARRHQLNQELFSHGVRKGFQVELYGAEEKSLRVLPGAAIDKRGRELWLSDAKVLQPLSVADGNYILCMQAGEQLSAQETYAHRDPAKKDNRESTWTGHTRKAEIIEFSLVNVKQLAEIAGHYIRLAQVESKDGRFFALDNGQRQLSNVSVDGSLNIRAAGHYIDMVGDDGKLNAYIGAKDGVTFSSAGNRMSLFGDGALYVRNMHGMVVATDWGGSGTLHVQGKAFMQHELQVNHDALFKGPVQALGAIQFAGAELKSHTAEDKKTGAMLDSQKGNLYLHGNEALYITNRRGVFIGKEGDYTCGLTVAGKTTVNGDFQADQGALFKGTVQALGTIQVAGAELKSHTEVGGKTFPLLYSHAGNLYLGGEQALCISNKQGVVIKKEAGSSGDLTVEGETTLKGNLTLPGGVFKYHAGNPNVEERNRIKGIDFSSGAQRLHISGDEKLYLLNKGGVVICNDWGGSAEYSLEVKGKSTFRELVTFNSGTRSLTDINTLAKKELKKDGEFLFLVEKKVGTSEEKDVGNFFIFWRTSGVIKSCHLKSNLPDMKGL
jgi:hypothetical protein